MNPEQALSQVEEAIKNRPVSPAKRWAILYINGKIKCQPSRAIIDNGNVFGYYTDDELNTGFTKRQWNLLLFEIAEFLHRKGLS